MRFRILAAVLVVLASGTSGLIAYDRLRVTPRLAAIESRVDAANPEITSDAKNTVEASPELNGAERMIIEMGSTLINSEEFRLTWGPGRLAFPCIDPHMETVRADVDALPVAFSDCRGALTGVSGYMPDDLSEPELFAIFVTIVANRLAPYGESTQLDWRLIGQEEQIHCGQHSTFIASAIKHFYPEVDVLQYGLAEGPVGDHALVGFTRGDASMILDGTTALVAFADMDDALSGELLNNYQTIDFYVGTDVAVERLRRNVRGALRMGAIRPEDVTYIRPPSPS